MRSKRLVFRLSVVMICLTCYAGFTNAQSNSNRVGFSAGFSGGLNFGSDYSDISGILLPSYFGNTNYSFGYNAGAEWRYNRYVTIGIYYRRNMFSQWDLPGSNHYSLISAKIKSIYPVLKLNYPLFNDKKLRPYIGFTPAGYNRLILSQDPNPIPALVPNGSRFVLYNPPREVTLLPGLEISAGIEYHFNSYFGLGLKSSYVWYKTDSFNFPDQKIESISIGINLIYLIGSGVENGR